MTTGSTGIAYAPTISGMAADQSTTNEAPVTPFSGVTIGDENPDATDTLTITVSGGDAGVGFVPAYGWLIGAGPSSASGGVGGVDTYTLSGTAAAITGELDALVFTLGGGTPNTRSTFEFTLSDVSNADSTPAVASTMVTDTDPAVAPLILGAVAGQTATFGAAVKPFSGVEVLDHNASPFDILTISLSNGGSGGTLTGAGLSGGSGGVYTLSGVGLAFESELDALVFTPTNGTPNTSATTDFTLSDVAVNSTQAVDSTTTVTVTDPAVAPTISGTVAGQTSIFGTVVKPFSGVTIGDANNGAIDTLTITLSNGGSGGTLTGAGLSGGSGGVYTLSGTAAAITGELEALSFTPASGTPGASATTAFTLGDASSADATPAVDATTTVTVTDPAVAPTISGTVAGQTTANEAPVTPFSGVTIGDANNGAIDTLTITLSNGGSGGTLTGAGLSGGSGGVYALSGTAAAITGELEALSFTPANGTPGAAATTAFTLSDASSADATPTVDATTTVTVTDPAVAPTISGTVAGQSTTNEAPVTPFSGVTIGDANNGASDTLTITVSGGGVLADGTGFDGLTSSGSGVYTLSGTAAAITSELDALTFGSGAAGTSTLTLSDVSSDDATPTVDSTTTVTVTAPTGAISETAAYVSDNIDALNADANVTSITLTDSGTPTLTLTTAQALSDKTALGEITNANYAIAISDTAANVSANIGALNADAKVTSITLTGGGLLTLTAAHAIDDTTALGKITNIAIVVFDSAANVAASLDALNADTEVTSITLADTGTPTLTLTAAQALNDTSALGKITTAYAIAISDTAANVSANLAALNADRNVTSITLTDSGTPTLTLTSAQALGDTTALGKITNANYAVAISDTAANVAANLGALNAARNVTSITLTDSGTPTLTLTAAEALGDTTALGKITNANYAVAISDTAANVAANLGALNADAKVTSITLTDSGTPTLTLTAAEALGDTTALGEITNANYAIAISDTAANIAANLAALNVDRNVTSITLTDSGTPTLTLTAAEALDDTTALGKITNANYAVAISDTAADVAANLDALNANQNVTSITLTDGGTPTLTITQNQALNDVAALAKIQGSYTLVISDPGVYNATAFTAAQVSLWINAGTPVLVTPNGTEILSGVTTIDLNGATITVNGDTLTQTNADGSSLVSTFDITGQIYTSRVIAYGSDGQLESKTYNGVTGDGTLSSFEYLYTSGNQVGSGFFYTGITGQAYTGEEVDYNGADQLTRVALTGVTGTGYSAYEYDYVGGVLEGSQFTVTDVPQGASYSSYQLDYNAAGQFTGDKFFFTNLPDQSYNYEEEDFDANGQLAKVYISGVTGQAYSALEEDYSAGVYTGYKAYYAAPQGANYTTEEVDVNAANQIQKAVYTGMIGTPYSAVEVDYNNGAEADAIYAFTNVTGAAYNAYQVEENASGAVMETTYHLNNGGYAIVGAQNGLTINSIGDDTMTGGGSGETFVFNGVYGHDTITDFSSYATGANHDTISLSTSEFANFNAVTSAATNSGSNAVITAANGDTLTLKNMNVATLSTLSSDFTFHA